MSTTVAGRIGPNAIIQTAEALCAHVGEAHARALVQRATGYAPGRMPTDMVEEAEVIRLMHALRRDLDPALHEAVLRDAGARTAEYLIAHRIPRLAQRLMAALPAEFALRVLLAGIMRHTWTFAGTARVTVTRPRGWPMRLEMAHCPMCRDLRATAPQCHFYAGTLERLLTRLVAPRATVREVACEAMGDATCSFALVLR